MRRRGGTRIQRLAGTAAAGVRELVLGVRYDLRSLGFELIGPPEFRDVWQSIDFIGGFSRERADALVLYWLAKRAAAQGRVVEVGSFLGRSTAVLAQAVRAARGEPVIAIDPHRGGSGDIDTEDLEGDASTLPLLRHNLRRLGLEAHVEIVRADAATAARDWSFGDISLLFIDALHTYEGVCADFTGLEPRLARGAVVLFDDYRRDEYPGVVRAVDDLEREGRLPKPGRSVNRYRVFGIDSWRSLRA